MSEGHLRRMIAASLHMSDNRKLVRKLRKRSTFSGKSATILAALPEVLYASLLFQTHVHFAILARTRTRAHPAILCFYLHLFTDPSELVVIQLIRGEGFAPFFLHLCLHRPCCNFILYSFFIHAAQGNVVPWLAMVRGEGRGEGKSG